MGATDFSILPDTRVIFPEAVFRAGSATQVPFTVQGTTGQTANLFEVKNTAGSVLSYVGPDGTWVGSLRLQAGTVAMGAVLDVSSDAVGRPAIRTRGFSVASTANIQEWQISDGSVRTRVGHLGALGVNMNAEGTAWLAITSVTPTDTISVFRGAASQTGAFTQWQNSAGSALSSVYSDGTFSGGNRVGPKFYAYDGGTATTRAGFGVDMSGNGNELSLFSNNASNASVRVGNWNGTTLDWSIYMGTGSANSSFIVKGRATQTGSLQEWQNGSGTVQAAVGINGQIQTIGGSGAGILDTRQGVLIGNSGNDTISGNPGNGGFIYVNGTALMYRSSNGVSYKVAGP